MAMSAARSASNSGEMPPFEACLTCTSSVAPVFVSRKVMTPMRSSYWSFGAILKVCVYSVRPRVVDSVIHSLQDSEMT